MITNQMKDNILRKIATYGKLRQEFQLSELAEEHGCDNYVIREIFLYFKRKGIIKDFSELSDDSVSFDVNVEAFDLYNAGGYTAQEELLQISIQKLLLEIESLKPSMPDKVSQITGIAANITTALSLIVR